MRCKDLKGFGPVGSNGPATPERMTPEAAGWVTPEALSALITCANDRIPGCTEIWTSGDDGRTEPLYSAATLAALAQRVADAKDQVAFQRDVIESCRAHKAELLARAEAAEARADALEKEAGRLREFVRRCSYAHLFPVDGLKLSSEAKAALSEPSDDTPTPSEADDHGR